MCSPPKMQAGNDNINKVNFVPFTTMSDLKDTHYLDSVWFNYETTEYLNARAGGSVCDGHAAPVQPVRPGGRCWCSTSWSR